MIIVALLSVMIYVTPLKVNKIALPLFKCANSAQKPPFLSQYQNPIN